MFNHVSFTFLRSPSVPSPCQSAERLLNELPYDCELPRIEREVAEMIKKTVRAVNGRRPEVVVIAHEMDPRIAQIVRAQAQAVSAVQCSAVRWMDQWIRRAMYKDSCCL